MWVACLTNHFLILQLVLRQHLGHRHQFLDRVIDLWHVLELSEVREANMVECGEFRSCEKFQLYNFPEIFFYFFSYPCLRRHLSLSCCRGQFHLSGLSHSTIDPKIQSFALYSSRWTDSRPPCILPGKTIEKSFKITFKFTASPTNKSDLITWKDGNSP